MPGELQRLETNYTELLEAVSYLTEAEGGTIIAGADPSLLLNFGGLVTPFAVVVFNGESAAPTSAIREVGALQQTDMEWSIFLGASSFATSGEGRLGTGIYQMIDDVIAAVQGKTLSVEPPARPFYVRSRRFNITANQIVYEVVFRNQFLREQYVA